MQLNVADLSDEELRSRRVSLDQQIQDLSRLLATLNRESDRRERELHERIQAEVRSAERAEKLSQIAQLRRQAYELERSLDQPNVVQASGALA